MAFLEVGKYKIKRPANSISGESSLLGLHMVVFSWVLTWQGEGASKFFSVSSYKGTNPIMRSLPSWPHLTLTTHQRPYLHIPSSWRLCLQHMNWGVCGGGGDTSIQSSTSFIQGVSEWDERIRSILLYGWVYQSASGGLDYMWLLPLTPRPCNPLSCWVLYQTNYFCNGSVILDRMKIPYHHWVDPQADITNKFKYWVHGL